MHNDQRRHLEDLQHLHAQRLSGTEHQDDSQHESHVASTYATDSPSDLRLNRVQAPVSNFVGRRHELDQLTQTLRQSVVQNTAGLANICGKDGVGKTELVHMLAQRLAPLFPDGQIIVSLGGINNTPVSATQALQSVIHSFKRSARLSDDLARLQTCYQAALKGKRVLILADGARDLQQVQELIPPAGCALLITSRTRLTLPSMTVVKLEPLVADDAEQLVRAICPDIGAAAARLATLCGHVPLALRISASLLANGSPLSVSQYLAQLADEQAQLAQIADSGSRTLDVEATLRLSYRLLSPAAQEMLCQLRVFPTSFDLAAVRAVIAVAGEVEELLEQLCRWSIVIWDEASARYTLHDLVRVFAAARLEDAVAVRLRHARYYSAVAAHAEALHVQGKTALRAGLALFDRERLHIDSGWRWLLTRTQSTETDMLLRDYAAATINIGALRYDKRHERIPQLTAALAAVRRLGDRNLEGLLLGLLGNTYFGLGEMRSAIDSYMQGLTIVRELGDQRREGHALGNLGNAHFALGETRRAIDYYAQRLTITRELGDQRGKGHALGCLGIAYKNLGETQRAIDFYTQWLLIARELGDRREEGHILGNLGIAYKNLGELRTAIAYCDQELSIAHECKDRRGEGHALGNLGNIYFALGDVQRAVEYQAQALAITCEIGDRRGESHALGNLGRAYAVLGDVQMALSFCEQSLAIKCQTGDLHGRAQALNCLACAILAQGDARRAVALHGQALTLIRQAGDRWYEGHILRDMGEAYVLLNDLRRARCCFVAALELARAVADRYGEAKSSWDLGLLLEEQHDLGAAIESMEPCLEFERAIGHVSVEQHAAHVERIRQRLRDAAGGWSSAGWLTPSVLKGFR